MSREMLNSSVHFQPMNDIVDSKMELLLLGWYSGNSSETVFKLQSVCSKYAHTFKDHNNNVNNILYNVNNKFHCEQ